MQVNYYTDKITHHEGWQLAGIFADDGISGVSTKKRDQFNEMIELCRKKKIDLILTKSISRFARNTLDCIKYVRVDVYKRQSSTSRMLLSVMLRRQTP